MGYALVGNIFATIFIFQSHICTLDVDLDVSCASMHPFLNDQRLRFNIGNCVFRVPPCLYTQGNNYILFAHCC